ncbi:hypothetical protein [Nannocystis punicea]|uniref:Outer membrane protein beta-barrel domain-containing protein n=1 Tax=Nannocystis punicea TaxID=2995304 RepID=A0ABY7H9H0_9BACT|nr:hypothetical protein [Nannocystis poenicansa]WAS95916.1 hypothetical protein O0S08_07105 [Nannocystis poenicansa]
MALAPQLAVVAWLVLAAAPLELHTDAVDHRLTETGLRARVGDDLDAWTISVRPGSTADALEVRLRGPDGATRTRRLVLTGATREDRSRELAASLTLLMDEAPSPPRGGKPATPPPPARRPPYSGWLGLGPRVEAGPKLVEGGIDVMGGAWLLREHLQPIASLGLGGAAPEDVSLFHLRFGGGLAAGAPLFDRRIWLGGHVLAHALRSRLRERDHFRVDWTSSTEIGATLQYRGRRLFLGARTGVDLVLPARPVPGHGARIRRGPAQWMLGLVVGVVFG